MAQATQSIHTPSASFIDQMLVATEALPREKRELFNAVYLEGVSPEEATTRFNASGESLEERHRDLLRSLRHGLSGFKGMAS